MVLCQGKDKNGQVDRNPAAIIIDKRVNEGNVDRQLSMLARFHAIARALVKFPFGKIVEILSIRPNDIRYVSTKSQFVSAASNAYTQPKAHSVKFTNVAIKKIVPRS